jgi:hypothetical protein
MRKVPLLVNGETRHAHSNTWSRLHDRVGGRIAAALFTEYTKQLARIDSHFDGAIITDIDGAATTTYGLGATTMFGLTHKRRDYINVLTSIYDDVVWDQPIFLHLLCLLRADSTLRRAKAFTNDLQFCSSLIAQVEKCMSTIKDNYPILALAWNSRLEAENNTVWYFVQTKAILEYRLKIGQPVCRRPIN